MSSAYGELRPELKVQLENHIKGMLSETFSQSEAGGSMTTFPSYTHFQIVKIRPLAYEIETTAKVHFNNKIEDLIMRTDLSGANVTGLYTKIAGLSMGPPSPGTHVEPLETVPEEPEDYPPEEDKRGGSEKG